MACSCGTNVETYEGKRSMRKFRLDSFVGYIAFYSAYERRDILQHGIRLERQNKCSQFHELLMLVYLQSLPPKLPLPLPLHLLTPSLLLDNLDEINAQITPHLHTLLQLITQGPLRSSLHFLF